MHPIFVMSEGNKTTLRYLFTKKITIMKKIIFAVAMLAMMCVGNVVYAQTKKAEPIKTEQTAAKKAENKTAVKKVVKANKAKKAEAKTAKKCSAK